MNERAPSCFVGPPARPEDYESFVLLARELGTNDPIPGREKWQDEMAPTTLFLCEGEKTLAYAYFNLMGETAYVRHLAVAPDRRGRGIGRKVMNELAIRFRSAGMSSWCLNVKPENVAAVRLYQSVGMRRVHSSRALRFSWDLVKALPMSDAVQAGEVREGEDRAIESELKLQEGQIADLRRKPSRVLLWLSRGGRPVGFAAFDPGFPGAFPFRVHREDARALLEAMMGRARPELSHIQVVAEDNPGLADALIDAGAEVTMAFEHYRGALSDP